MYDFAFWFSFILLFNQRIQICLQQSKSGQADVQPPKAGQSALRPQVVWWGKAPGADQNTPPLAASGVRAVASAARAFAAIKVDGSVVAWGDRLAGGDVSQVKAGAENWWGETQVESLKVLRGPR